MRMYLLASGAIFALLLLAHVARVAAEGAHLLREPFFVLTTLGSAGMCAWAWRLWRRG